MKKFLILCFISLSLFADGKVVGGILHEMPDWFKQSFLEIEEDIAEATADNKHIMLFLHLNECPYCSTMVDDLNENKQRVSRDFDVIAINIKGDKEIEMNEMETLSEREMATMLGVKYTPTIVFLSKNNEIVARTNGYRKPQDFAKVMDFVKGKYYLKTNFAEYKSNLQVAANYEFIANDNFKNITDLSKIKTPLAIIFEGKDCIDCEYFHTTTLKNDLIKKEFSAYNIVRFDASSDKEIISPSGEKMSIKDFAKKLQIAYKPSVILFNNNEEKLRIDGFLYSWHFSEALRFVAKNLAEKFASYGQYLGFRQQELTKQGIDINIAN